MDFALWGGIVPGNVGALDELAARGVVGFKAFMSASGIDDFPRVGRPDALRGHGAAPPARAAGRGARGERGDHRAASRRGRGRPGAPACATTSPPARPWRSWRRSPRAILLRRGDRLRAACRACQHRARRGAGRCGPGPRRRRELRNVPALPAPDRGGRRGARRGREVRAPAARQGECDALWARAGRRQPADGRPPTTRPRRPS